MRSITLGGLNLLMVVAVISMATGCGKAGPEGAAAETGGQPATAKRDAKEPSGRTDMPPADYVPYRCGTCACRVFMGEGPNCKRPSCRHHWSDHQQPTS